MNYSRNVQKDCERENKCHGEKRKCEEKCKERISVEDQKEEHTNIYDYVIVGLGTSGSVLTSLLSAHRCKSVLALEQGVNNDNDPVILRTQPRSLVLGINRDPKYSVPQLTNLPSTPQYRPPFTPADVNPSAAIGLSGNFEAAGTGRGWGGSTIHYHLFAVRGSADIYDFWASFSGNDRWKYRNMLPFMKAIERFVPKNIPIDSVEQDQRGFDGPLTITQSQTPQYVAAFPIAQSIISLGTPQITDFNVSPQGDNGVSSNQEFKTNQSCATRTFASQAFLPSSVVTPDGYGVDGRKLRIISKTRATRVIFKENKAIGVEYNRTLEDGTEECVIVYAKKRVILCLGTIETAHLLQLSGVGPITTLQGQGFNIPLVVNSPHVGFHLKNHNGILAGIDASAFTGDYDPRNPLPNDCSSPNINKGHDLRIQAYVGNQGAGAGLFPLADYPQQDRIIQIFSNHGPNLTSRIVSQNEPIFSLVSSPGNLVMTMQMEFIRPKSEGVVFVADKDPRNFPRVDFNYYGDYIAPTGGPSAVDVPGTDAYTVVQSILMAKRIADKSLTDPNIPNFTLVYPPPAHFPPSEGGTGSRARLFRDAQDSATPAHHYIGTARMAKSIGVSATQPINAVRPYLSGDDGGVVDGNLHVFGTRHLMCASNAIAPQISTGNTALQAMYIGAVAASILMGNKNALRAIHELPTGI
jgi:choline dehydrogenase-like flavoprotein